MRMQGLKWFLLLCFGCATAACVAKGEGCSDFSKVDSMPDDDQRRMAASLSPQELVDAYSCAVSEYRPRRSGFARFFVGRESEVLPVLVKEVKVAAGDEDPFFHVLAIFEMAKRDPSILSEDDRSSLQKLCRDRAGKESECYKLASAL